MFLIVARLLASVWFGLTGGSNVAGADIGRGPAARGFSRMAFGVPCRRPLVITFVVDLAGYRTGSA